MSVVIASFVDSGPRSAKFGRTRKLRRIWPTSRLIHPNSPTVGYSVEIDAGQKASQPTSDTDTYFPHDDGHEAAAGHTGLAVNNDDRRLVLVVLRASACDPLRWGQGRQPICGYRKCILPFTKLTPLARNSETRSAASMFCGSHAWKGQMATESVESSAASEPRNARRMACCSKPFSRNPVVPS